MSEIDREISDEDVRAALIGLMLSYAIQGKPFDKVEIAALARQYAEQLRRMRED